ncbi:MAG: DUF2723 domain-containing protein [bacterium]|nr:DUF2723 domain-containing protein [bacterium]
MENRLIVQLKQPKILAWLVVVFPLIGIYATTMQTIPNGSGHYFMIDVGETQLVLNLWGSLHSTGYPLYVMLGNVLTAIMRLVGISPIVAPAIVSLIWGILALTLLYMLAYHYTHKAWLSAVVIGIFGLARTVWVHHIIAEIYTFGLLIGALLLIIALWKNPIRGRMYWLAFIGGIGVAHHRAIAMMIPALLIAMLPYFWEHRREMPKMVIISLLLGCIGFGQYLYMYLRGIAGGAWVYGEPQTWAGVWTQFIGTEASRFIGIPQTAEALQRNFDVVNSVLEIDLTLLGIIIGIIGLLVGLIHQRKLALVMIANGLVAYLFHVFFYTDILSALILPILVSLVFGWLLLIVELVLRIEATFKPILGGHRIGMPISISLYTIIIILLLSYAGGTSASQNLSFLQDITTNQDGIKTINTLKNAPDGSVVMVTWGPNHFAAGIGRDLTGELAHITLVDHKADYAGILAEGKMLITPDFTIYTQPPAWWEERLGRIYPIAVAPNLVQIKTTPELSDDAPIGITVVDSEVVCTDTMRYLYVTWQTGDIPTENLRVFVHGYPMEGPIMGQADQPSPVYTWRPTTSWIAGEIVRDVYPLPRPRRDAIFTIRFGMYRLTSNGGFENVSEYDIKARCD